MKYLLLIYEDEQAYAALSEAERGQLYREYETFTQSIIESGHFRSGSELQPTAHAMTVRHRNGQPATTDGPFAETKEQLGGFYMVECRDLDEALAIASRIPTVRTGSIEVRPLVETSVAAESSV